MASTSDAGAPDLESIKRKLIKSLASSWEEVVKIYEQDPRAHKIKIGPSGNTALHIGVSSGREDIVERLVKSIAKNGNPVDVLSIGNRDGNNPLHLGASLGSISMCRSITGGYRQMLGTRNEVGDTPLLRAARYGKKDVFLWLYDICEGNTAHDYCQNPYDGKYINPDAKNALRLAIEGGHMDLAFQIICKQEDLMDAVDNDGFSPLHVLAEKPTAFRSGIHLSWFNQIIYHCISVEELIPAGTSKAKKNFFQELRKLIKLPGHNSSNIGAQGHKPFPSKYGRCLRFIKLLVSQVLLVIISVMLGSSQIRKLKEKKEMHVWSLQILNKLLERAARCTYEMSPKNDEAGRRHHHISSEYRYFDRGGAWVMTPILLASSNGIVEMVEKILQRFPMAIYDGNENLNVVLVAAENRQSHIYDFLLNSSLVLDREVLFHAVDYSENNALHLAGKLAGNCHLQRIPTSMLQMQWEVKWYQHVQNSLPPHFVVQKNEEDRNGKRRTPDEIFQIEHQKLEDKANNASVPGGVKQDTGEPVFENHLAFSIFAMASLVALCCSVISLLIFLTIFISKDQDKDFTTNLPRNFLFGLTSLFISMAAMLTCFCSGNFLMLKGQLKYAAILVYALTGLLMAYFVLKHFPLFIGLLKASFRKVPERIYKEYL
ncbi:hypothetical protein PVL29_009409 [Vitis rotundifolia]|uniref:PGG domain-containing protein n=1 Tax=Vitis rotundifolia TaxID=103349 RepID=A0AA39DXH5_VITRO|nr:hypothetical protein PVL29_009409 [Vitis rotundifolia]